METINTSSIASSDNVKIVYVYKRPSYLVRAQDKYYNKNKDLEEYKKNRKECSKKYYQKNKEQINKKRRERYAMKKKEKEEKEQNKKVLNKQN